MIKYEETINQILVDVYGNDANDPDWTDKPKVAEKVGITLKNLLSRQIDEDNKRFLGMIGEDEKPESYYPKILTESELSMASDAVSFHARNELRQELRDKVNKE